MLELARCEYVDRLENIIALGYSGTGKTHVALGGSLLSDLVVFAQKGRQLELLEMMGEQDLWGLAHGRDPPIKLI